MHKYLRAVGFASLNKRSDYEDLIRKITIEGSDRAYTSLDDDSMIAVYRQEFAPGAGIAVVGEFGEDNQFFYDYSYPYIQGSIISSYEDLSIERHAEKESYAGVCDEARLGVSLIFYLQNIIQYIRVKNAGLLPVKGTSVTLSALSVQGIVMMPIAKTESDIDNARKAGYDRIKLVEAARKGDEKAMESLTLDDMDTYTAISKKIRKDDIFTIVDTYFMPYGVECDHYSILGEILGVDLVTNKVTGEEIYKLQIKSNEVVLDVCINRLDLFGQPEVGRRFKGVIWLQGYINYPN